MQWLEVTVKTTSQGIEQVADALTAAGFDSLVVEDQAELEEFLDDNRAYWDYIDETLERKLQGLSQIRLYIQRDEQENALLARLEKTLECLKKRLPGEPLTMEAVPMEETDWEESWKDNYPPQEVGRNLVVLPCWLAEEYGGGRIPVILDPGLTFGTGAHPSTRMCMEFMEQQVKPGMRVIDLGSGSGILSIAALRLGAGSATGVDIDPKAEDIARENAAYNGFAAPEFTACTGNVLADRARMEQLSREKYDLVLVNIVADVIIALAPILPEFMAEGGVVICSGILDVRLNEVTAALRDAGLRVVDGKSGEDWRCVMARKEAI